MASRSPLVLAPEGLTSQFSHHPFPTSCQKQVGVKQRARRLNLNVPMSESGAESPTKLHWPPAPFPGLTPFSPNSRVWEGCYQVTLDLDWPPLKNGRAHPQPLSLLCSTFSWGQCSRVEILHPPIALKCSGWGGPGLPGVKAGRQEGAGQGVGRRGGGLCSQQRSGQRGPGDNQGQADMRPGPRGLDRGCQAP